MIYLNNAFEAGATSFAGSVNAMSERPNLKINPVKGMALLFHHPIPHIGETVTAGRKYVLRTDVMFTRKPNDTRAKATERCWSPTKNWTERGEKPFTISIIFNRAGALKSGPRPPRPN
jgi:hypothetical protein